MHVIALNTLCGWIKVACCYQMHPSFVKHSPLCLAVSLSRPKLALGHSQFVKIPTRNEANHVNNESGIIAVLVFEVPVTVIVAFLLLEV